VEVNGPPPTESEQVIDEVAKVALAAAVVTGVALTGSGVWLALFYRPTPAAGDPFAAGRASSGDANTVDWVRFAHQWSARLFVLALIIVLALAVLRTLQRNEHLTTVLLAGAACVVAGVGFYTGKLLPFDQVALWGVAADDSMLGYRSLFDDRLRWIIVGGRQVSPGTVIGELAVHALVVPVVLIVLLAVGALLGRRPHRGR
jgi:quinol-cytochrome oxidoreductase complex cytochrome b subunit